METFFELQAAAGDWVALKRPALTSVSLILTPHAHGGRRVQLPFRSAPVRPTDWVLVRQRVVAAVRAFVGAAYPAVHSFALVACECEGGRPTSILSFRGPVGAEQSIEESHGAEDFNTTDEFPVNPDGTLGKQHIRRSCPKLARICRQSARKRERERQQEQGGENADDRPATRSRATPRPALTGGPRRLPVRRRPPNPGATAARRSVLMRARLVGKGKCCRKIQVLRIAPA
jgi:hypothetical protein